jgi:hypothetical protein
MKYLLMLAAAASLAACHQRSEDEVGAAPDQGDTTAVVADTGQGVPTDTTMGQVPAETDTSFVQPDTTTGVDSAVTDTLSQPTGDTTGAVPSDTTGAVPSDTGTGTWSDTTAQDTSGMDQPADSTYQQ